MSAAWQRGPAKEQPGQPHRRDSPQSARNADAVPNMTPEAIAEAAAVEVRRLEEAVGALGKESPHAKPLLVALNAAKAQTQRLHQRPDRVNDTEFGTSQEEVGAGRSRGRQSRSTEGPMCCRCGSSRTEVGAVARFSAVRDATGARGVGSVAKSHPNQGHVEVAASSAEEANMIRANVDSLERERAMLRAEVARCRAKCRPVRVDVDFNRPRRGGRTGSSR